MNSLPVFISLTTIRLRISTLNQVLESLLNQRLKPNRIIVNVSSGPFMLDQGIEFGDLPGSVRELHASEKIDLQWVENRGPYRKLLPTLAQYQNDDFLIATADDDVIYPADWLASLVETYNEHQCVVAYRCRALKFGPYGLSPYLEWPVVTRLGDKGSKSQDLLPTGRSGILYHSSHFGSLDMLNAFRELAPAQDDIAFRWATMVRGIPVALADYGRAGALSVEFPGIHNAEQLFLLNGKSDGKNSPNDEAWNKIARFCIKNNLASDCHKRLIIACPPEEADAGL